MRRNKMINSALLTLFAFIITVFSSCNTGSTTNIQEYAGIWKLQDASLAEAFLPEGTTYHYFVINTNNTAEIWINQGLSELFDIEPGENGITYWTHTETPRNPEWEGGEFMVEFNLSGNTLSGSFYPEDNSWLWEPVFDRVNELPVFSYDNDFEGNNLTFLNTDEWEIIDDSGNAVFAPITSDGNSDTDIDIYGGKNFTIEFDVKRTQSADSDEKCWMVLDFDHYTSPGGTYNSYWLNSHFPGSFYFGDRNTDISDFSYSTGMTWNTWHKIKVTVRSGKYYQFFLDGNLFGEREVEETLISGFKIEGNPDNGIWYFDNLSITWNEIPAEINPDFSAMPVLTCREGEILAMSTDGTTQYQLTHNDDGEWWPNYISGTDRIMFIRDSTDNGDLYTINNDKTDEQLLLENVRLASPTPDGSKIVFQSDRDSGNDLGDIFIMNTDGSGIVNLTNSTDIDDLAPTVSPDGTKIAYVTGQGHSTLSWRVWTMDINGSNKQAITPDSGIWNTDQFEATEPKWSPDGSEIIFQSTPFQDANHIQKIYQVSSTANGDDVSAADDPVLLYDGGTVLSHSPTYNSDGSLIYFVSDGAIWTMNADGSNPAELHPRPSKDGWYYNFGF